MTPLQANPKAAPYAGLYARFNLGVALVKAGDETEGQALLDSVGQAPGPDEEVRSLRDRANVALGFANLAGKLHRDARNALQRVRLNGPQSNKALLGFGWASLQQQEPRRALVAFRQVLAGNHAQQQGNDCLHLVQPPAAEHHTGQRQQNAHAA